MNKNLKVGLIVGVVVLVLGALIGITVWQSSSESKKEPVISDYEGYKLSKVKEMAALNDYSDFDVKKIIAANAQSGNLPENVNGSKDASVVIVEYADYQCSYCAAMNSLINKIVEDYDGKVAVVMRSYVLSYHPNGVQGAAAANAAAIQGYWKGYKDLLFANQSDWFYSEGEELQEQLEEYFMQATGGKGDLEKFREDMKSEAVLEKIAFDQGLGEEAEIGGTPWFYLDGKWIENDNLAPAKYAEKIREVIDQKLGK